MSKKGIGYWLDKGFDEKRRAEIVDEMEKEGVDAVSAKYEVPKGTLYAWRCVKRSAHQEGPIIENNFRETQAQRIAQLELDAVRAQAQRDLLLQLFKEKRKK